PHCQFVFLRSKVCLPLLSAFASRLGLAVRLRLPSSAPIGSFHPIRFCPCWAHPARAPAAQKLSAARSTAPAPPMSGLPPPYPSATVIPSCPAPNSHRALAEGKIPPASARRRFPSYGFG